MRMIYNVADQECGRRDQGENHTGHVALPDVSADPEPAHCDKHGADGVERCIDCREILNSHGYRFTPVVLERLRLAPAVRGF